MNKTTQVKHKRLLFQFKWYDIMDHCINVLRNTQI